MLDIIRNEKEVVLKIVGDRVTQNIRVPYTGASYYVEEFLISFYDMYERHKHTCRIKETIGDSDMRPPLDWRNLVNTMMDSLVRHAFNAVQHGKADLAMVTNAMDVAYYMFADIHEFYRNHQD